MITYNDAAILKYLQVSVLVKFRGIECKLDTSSVDHRTDVVNLQIPNATAFDGLPAILSDCNPRIMIHGRLSECTVSEIFVDAESRSDISRKHTTLKHFFPDTRIV